MKYLPAIILSLACSVSVQNAAELASTAKSFVEATLKNDIGAFEELYLESSTKPKAIEGLSKEFEEVSELIKAGKLTASSVDKELVIGDLGVTLMQIDFEEEDQTSFRPIVCVRTPEGWRVFPWFSTSDLEVLADSRTPEERIHIQLFNRWANLMEDLLLEQQKAEQGVAPQSATRSESDPEGSDKPQPESEERSR